MPESPPAAEQRDGRVARRAGLVALGTLGSRALGMAREVVVAATFHVAATDAFFIAFTIPNTLRQVLGEGAVSNAFVPMYTETRARGSAQGRTFLAGFLGALGLLLLLATAAGMLAAPTLTWMYAGGFRDDPAKLAETAWLTRWLFPFLALAGLSALATGALNVMGRFGLPALSPALLNISMILCALLLAGSMASAGLSPINSLVIGALLGGVLQVILLSGLLKRQGMLPRPRFGFTDPDVRRALGLMVPLLFGMGVYQLNILLSRLFASFLQEGAPSYLSYGQRVVEIPQGMFALALASAALPTLSKLRAEGRQQEVLALFRYSLRMTLFIGLPASVAVLVLAEPVVATLYGRGQFGALQVTETARSLQWQACGVWAVASVRAIIPMFAAHKDTRTPVMCSFVNLVVFVGMSLLLMGAWQHEGLAAANALAAGVQVVALLWLLRRQLGPLGLDEVLGSGAKSLMASVSMGALLWGGQTLLGNWVERSDLLRVAALGVLVVAGAATYFAGARLLKAREPGELLSAVRRRTNRS